MATWNILATSYIRRSFYPNSGDDVLNPAWRIPALVARAAELGVDILCLQEVDRVAFAALAQSLGPLGYSASSLALKEGRKPDGCAAFLRSSRCKLNRERRLVYSDGSGHIAQILSLEINGTGCVVANTHLKWDPPQTPADQQFGLCEARQVVEELEADRSSTLQIICGDFNATPDSSLVAFLMDAGFDYAHRSCSHAFTCNSNQEAKLIDYIFYRGPVRVSPEALPAIDDSTPLPSMDQPSDHLPLIAEFTWTE